ncbi:hypothetical protein KCP73_12825 [Salmonella enterica subsp. enterica]|nr:hypothetical protein KCP73_12825 [Salmonella enterica subsp. enterica]
MARAASAFVEEIDALVENRRTGTAIRVLIAISPCASAGTLPSLPLSPRRAGASP